MPNKVYQMNFKGITGILLIALLIILGFLAITFVAILLAATAAAIIIGYIVKKLRGVFGKKQAPAESNQEPVVRKVNRDFKEIAEAEYEEEKDN